METWKRFDAALGSILEDGGKIMFFIFSAAALVVCLRYQLLAIPHPYSLDYGEAPLVDQAMRLASGQNIYRSHLSSPPYTISNYPPMYVSLLAIGFKLFGPAGSFHFGRILSVVSTWAAALFLALIVYSQTRDRVAAIGSGLILLAFPFVVYWSPLLRIDMLALALSLAGICVLIWQPVTPQRLVIAALLLAAAIFTRQSYALAAPLTAFVWLLWHDRSQALRLALLVGGLVTILFLLLNILTRGGFFFNIVTANVNEFTMEQLGSYAERVLEAAGLFLWIAVASLFLIPRWNRLWTLAAPYLVGATLSAVTIGKIGSNVNYLLELCAALSLAAGAVVAWSRVHISFHTLRATLLVLLAFAVGNMLNTTLEEYTWDLRERRTFRTELNQLKTLVAETPGAILADEYMGMLTLQGRPLVIQPFEVTQLAHAGKWNQTPLLESIRRQEYAAIILYDRPWSNERWTPEMLSAITESYMLVDIIAGNRVYQAPEGLTTTKIDACPGSSWRLPSDGSLGVQWENDGIELFGRGNEARIPVYAVADGLLTRGLSWVDAVAVLHDDPLRPEEKVWVYYGNMAAADGLDSFVAEDFPPGSSDIPVQSGQLLGYQGKWSGTPLWPQWVHMFFAMVDARGQDAFPQNIRSTDILDPAPYLGLVIEPGNTNLQPLKCKEP